MARTSDVATKNKNGAAATAATAALPQTSATKVNGGENAELRELLHALQAVRVGDFSVRMAGDQVGLMGKVADTFNEIVAANQRMAKQLERVGQVVGREGKTRQRVQKLAQLRIFAAVNLCGGGLWEGCGSRRRRGAIFVLGGDVRSAGHHDLRKLTR